MPSMQAVGYTLEKEKPRKTATPPHLGCVKYYKFDSTGDKNDQGESGKPARYAKRQLAYQPSKG